MKYISLTLLLLSLQSTAQKMLPADEMLLRDRDMNVIIEKCKKEAKGNIQVLELTRKMKKWSSKRAVMHLDSMRIAYYAGDSLMMIKQDTQQNTALKWLNNNFYTYRCEKNIMAEDMQALVIITEKQQVIVYCTCGTLFTDFAHKKNSFAIDQAIFEQLDKLPVL